MIKLINRITVKRLWNNNDMPSKSFRRSTIRRLADLLRPLTFITLVFCLGWAPPHLAAQGTSDIKAADTSSPRDTLRSFIEACNELHEHITSSPGTTIDLTRSMSPLPNGSWIALTIVSSQHLLARTVPARQPYASKRYWIEWSCHPGIRFPIWRRSSPPVDARNCQSIEFLTPESRFP